MVVEKQYYNQDPCQHKRYQRSLMSCELDIEYAQNEIYSWVLSGVEENPFKTI